MTLSNATPPIDSEKLDRLAEIAINVGLNLQPGQDMILTASTESLPLARRVVAAAYRAGAGVVTTLLADDEITRARYQYGHDDSFDQAPGWLYEGMANAFSANTARMAIKDDNPMLLADQDPAKIARAGKANSLAFRRALSAITGFNINWSIVAYPGAAWARQVFPDLPEN
jgi:aminopeptidase